VYPGNYPLECRVQVGVQSGAISGFITACNWNQSRVGAGLRTPKKSAAGRQKGMQNGETAKKGGTTKIVVATQKRDRRLERDPGKGMAAKKNGLSEVFGRPGGTNEFCAQRIDGKKEGQNGIRSGNTAKLDSRKRSKTVVRGKSGQFEIADSGPSGNYQKKGGKTTRGGKKKRSFKKLNKKKGEC